MKLDDSGKVIDQTSRLLDYLAAVARHIYVDPVRDIREYEPLLTPSHVPTHTRVHLGPTATNDSWLSIPRLTEPDPPKLYESLEGFVSDDSLNDLDGQPRFLEELGEVIQEDLDLLNTWISKEWLPWATKTKPIREARNLYDRVFSLSLRAQRDQATHEIVWGHAVLSWAGPKVVLVPMISTEVTIEIDDEGTLKVQRNGTPELEIDALEGLSLDGLEELSRLRARLLESSFDPWSEDSLNEVRDQLVAPLGLSATCVETDELLIPKTEIAVNSGWVLYLRKRPVRHDRFYSELSDVLQEGNFLPESMASIVADEKRLSSALQELNLGHSGDWDPSAKRLLMPLATNIDQERIAAQLASARGVTVQGPPGTGKSHTIVNLVCHLIAHGKRVLVTAQNEQALSVLRDKFPAELRDLTVSVLGSTPAAMDELHSSIQVVMDIASQTDVEAEQRRIDELGAQIDDAREGLRRTELKIIDALRDETREFEFPNGMLKAPDVAIWLAKNENAYGRIPDQVPTETVIPLTPQETAELYNFFCNIEPSDIEAFQLERPRAAALPTSEELREEVSQIDDIQRRITDLEESGLTVEAVDKSKVEDLNSLAEALLLSADRLDSLLDPWVFKTRESIRVGSDAKIFWQEQLEILAKQNRTCDEFRRKIIGDEIEFPEGDARIQLSLLDELIVRFKMGKSVPRFSNKPLKELFESIKFNGYSLRTAEETSKVQDAIRLKVEQRAIRVRLLQLASENEMPVPDLDARFNAEVESRIQKIGDALDWESSSKKQLNIDLQPFFGNRQLLDSPDALRSAARTLRDAIARHEERTLSKKHSELTKLLKASSSSVNASPMWGQLLEAQAGRDWGRWRLIIEESERVSSLGVQIDRLLLLNSKLMKVAPRWAQLLRDERANPDACGLAEDFSELWIWRMAETWLKDLHSSSDLTKLMLTATMQQNAVSRLVLDIAKRSAAVGIKRNMEDKKRRALQTWLQALQKRGKGTGKWAPHWENVARKELPVAMGAIPVWIMPIHRVIENFDPRKSELFDVVIVDESSQCDLLSVGVLALGRKAVVVGDDKQTSPAGVGIDQQEIIKLQEMYINDIDGKSLLTVTESLYGIAERVFSNVILLKEHFRCLPEIINFSNRYYDNRILPLREKPERDIGPVLNAVFVDHAACIGTGSNRVNKGEAAALVQQVIKCANDPAYEGLTFGVVTMLGNGQAPYIENMLVEALGIQEYQSRQLRVGNAPAFQGDERSVIFISMVADDNSYAATRKPDKQRVNVAASRAQDQLWVYYSVDSTTLHADDERRALIQYVQNVDKVSEPTEDQLDLCESEFERRVLRDVLSQGYKAKPQHPVGSYRIDMVVSGGVNRIAVECDGDSFHGPDQWEQDIKRQRVLERLGWNFWRVRASEYWRNPVEAMKPLWERLGELEKPSSVEITPPSRDLIENLADFDTEMLEITDFELDSNGDETFTDSEIEVIESEDLGSSLMWRGFEIEPDIAFGEGIDGIWLDVEKDVEVTGTPMASQGRVDYTTGLRSLSKVNYGSVTLTLAFTAWDSLTWQVECVDAEGAGPEVQRLMHGGRLGIYSSLDGDSYFAQMRIMKRSPSGSTTAQNPKEGELEDIIGWSLEDFLLESENIDQITTRGEYLGETGSGRSTPIAVWKEGGSRIPIIIYVATRLLPLLALDDML